MNKLCDYTARIGKYPVLLEIDADRFKFSIDYDQNACNPLIEWDQAFEIHWQPEHRYYLGSSYKYYKTWNDWLDSFAQYDDDYNEIDGNDNETVEGLWIPLNVRFGNEIYFTIDFSFSGLEIDKLESFPPSYEREYKGYAYIDKKRIIELVSNVTDYDLTKLYDVLKGELQEYSNYINGNVFGFMFKDYMNPDNDQSICGFYGDDFKENGLIESLPSEYREFIADIIKDVM